MLLADQSLCLVYLQLFIKIKLKLKLTFCFVLKCLISIFKFVIPVTYCFFTSCGFVRNQQQLLLFPCNPIGQLCSSGPGYSIRTAIVNIILRIYLTKQ